MGRSPMLETKMRATKTIERLVAMKRRSVEGAEAALASARTATLEAEDAQSRADRAWLAAHEGSEMCSAIVTVADLEVRDAELRHLRKAVDRSELELASARTREAEAQVVVTVVRTDLRRFEIWMERQAMVQDLEKRRQARLAEDEIAARKRGGR